MGSRIEVPPIQNVQYLQQKAYTEISIVASSAFRTERAIRLGVNVHVVILVLTQTCHTLHKHIK